MKWEIENFEDLLQVVATILTDEIAEELKLLQEEVDLQVSVVDYWKKY